MRTYSVIVFDLGNVLIPFSYDAAIKKFNKIEPSLGDKFFTFYKNNYELHRKFERGDISEENFINIILSELDFKVESETFCKFFSEIFVENKNVTALLPKFKKNYKLVLLSNTNSIHKKYGWSNYDFLNYFDKQILSHEVNAVKPEEKIYKAVENFTKLPPQEHLFIDDILDYVEGAKKLGWDGIQFINYEKLLEEFLIKKIIL